MASGRSRGHGPVQGSVKGEEKHWIDTAGNDRRFNHAMDVCRATVGQKANCLKCYQMTMECTEAGVTTKLGARSWWKCARCGHEYTREISPEQMAQYYKEDLNTMIGEQKAPSKTQEAEA
jgi:hypothetical protein